MVSFNLVISPVCFKVLKQNKLNNLAPELLTVAIRSTCVSGFKDTYSSKTKDSNNKDALVYLEKLQEDRFRGVSLKKSSLIYKARI